jgi:hypothetical protein
LVGVSVGVNEGGTIVLVAVSVGVDVGGTIVLVGVSVGVDVGGTGVFVGVLVGVDVGVSVGPNCGPLNPRRADSASPKTISATATAPTIPKTPLSRLRRVFRPEDVKDESWFESGIRDSLANMSEREEPSGIRRTVANRSMERQGIQRVSIDAQTAFRPGRPKCSCVCWLPTMMGLHSPA